MWVFKGNCLEVRRAMQEFFYFHDKSESQVTCVKLKIIEKMIGFLSLNLARCTCSSFEVGKLLSQSLRVL